MSELPTGIVTLLLADVEVQRAVVGRQADEMTAAVARLDRARSEIVRAHG